MAIVTIPERSLSIRHPNAVAEYLAVLGIQYERWDNVDRTAGDASADAILGAWADEIERLKAAGGYTKADLLDVGPQTPGLVELLASVRREHWHDVDEVWFILRGRGVFHIHSKHQPITAITVEPGDLVRIPRGTLHGFDLCAERTVRAIRFFREPGGWTPHYPGSGIETIVQPACFGPASPAG